MAGDPQSSCSPTRLWDPTLGPRAPSRGAGEGLWHRRGAGGTHLGWWHTQGHPWGRDSAQLSRCPQQYPQWADTCPPNLLRCTHRAASSPGAGGGRSIYLPLTAPNVTPDAPPALPCHWGPSSCLPPSPCSTFLEQSQVLPPMPGPPWHTGLQSTSLSLSCALTHPSPTYGGDRTPGAGLSPSLDVALQSQSSCSPSVSRGCRKEQPQQREPEPAGCSWEPTGG